MKVLTREQQLAAMKDLTGGELKVYMALNFYFNGEKGYAYPAFELIQETTGLCRNKIFSALNKLEEKSFIRREKNPDKKFNRNNIYYILDKGETVNRDFTEPSREEEIKPQVSKDEPPVRCVDKYKTSADILDATSDELREAIKVLEIEGRLEEDYQVRLKCGYVVDAINKELERRYKASLPDLTPQQQEQRIVAGLPDYAIGVDPVDYVETPKYDGQVNEDKVRIVNRLTEIDNMSRTTDEEDEEYINLTEEYRAKGYGEWKGR